MTITIDGTVGANKGVVLDSNGKLPAIDGSQVTTLSATQITTGTVATARLDTGTTAGKVLVLDGSGNMPAVDGSLMSGVSTATKSASDPAVDTNPATGLGTKWINTTTGDVYILTDATAGANVWTNSGAGTGDIQSAFQGSQYGFSAGGDMPGGSLTNVIEKYSYSSDGNATDHGDLIDVGNGGRNIGTGHRSRTHGYIAGGYSYPSPGALNNIEKYQFSTSSNSTDVGNLLQANWYMGASSSLTHGYCTGGPAPAPESNVIEKFSFSSDGNSSDVGNLTVARKYNMGGCTSIENGYGYHAGGHNVAAKNTIDKYAYASDGDATDAGDLYQHNYGGGTCSSTSYGWVLGGVNTTPATVNMIQKFAFVNNVTGTDVADLSVPHGSYPAGSSATTHGYKIGGYGSPTAGTGNVIDKFAYESTSNATDVGDSTYYGGFRSSCQY